MPPLSPASLRAVARSPLAGQMDPGLHQALVRQLSVQAPEGRPAAGEQGTLQAPSAAAGAARSSGASPHSSAPGKSSSAKLAENQAEETAALALEQWDASHGHAARLATQHAGQLRQLTRSHQTEMRGLEALQGLQQAELAGQQAAEWQREQQDSLTAELEQLEQRDSTLQRLQSLPPVEPEPEATEAAPGLPGEAAAAQAGEAAPAQPRAEQHELREAELRGSVAVPHFAKVTAYLQGTAEQAAAFASPLQHRRPGRGRRRPTRRKAQRRARSLRPPRSLPPHSNFLTSQLTCRRRLSGRPPPPHTPALLRSRRSIQQARRSRQRARLRSRQQPLLHSRQRRQSPTSAPAPPSLLHRPRSRASRRPQPRRLRRRQRSSSTHSSTRAGRDLSCTPRVVNRRPF